MNNLQIDRKIEDDYNWLGNEDKIKGKNLLG
jgi:hypothetical protein